MAVRGINYDEGNPNDYESVYIHYGDREEKVFASGNFVKDWYDALKWYLHADLKEHALCNSSSVDHFIMDGADFDSAYLVGKDGKGFLEYEYSESPELFVVKGTEPTWEELKAICDDNS